MKDPRFNFNNTYTDLPADFFHVNSPAGFPQPRLIIVNHALVESMGIDISVLSEEEQAALFCGNLIPDGSVPFSQAYAGHQFGHFTMLGDGRAHMMGEHITPDGMRFDIQFKGSGPTPYSRRGDGLAAIGPMLREYIISEALYALEIPTTRSLAVVSTGKTVVRDNILAGAVMTRVASSHIRVGTFEYAAATQKPNNLSALLNYTIKRHYPELQESPTQALCLLRSVIKKQVHLIVGWMRTGFIHGVMNTDNMALSGEAIDFGPCAFMDAYNPDQVFSSIDQHGRYAYSNQPKIAQWNLARLAESLLPLIDEDADKAVEQAKEVLMSFEEIYQQEWLTMMREKLGLLGEDIADEKLVSDLLEWMHRHGADFTNTFKNLSSVNAPTGKHFDHIEFTEWYSRYEKRRSKNGQTKEASITSMQKVNPAVIPRNHLVEQALAEAESCNLNPMHELLSVLKHPYDYSNQNETFQTPPNPSDRVYQTFCGT